MSDYPENEKTIILRPVPVVPGWWTAAAWACIYLAVGAVSILLLYHYWIYLVGLVIVLSGAAGKQSKSPSYPGRYKVKVW